MYKPTMSVSFSSKRMSLETLKVLLKWGLRPWLRHMRDIVAALAEACFGCRCRLAELVAVLFVLVHLVVRDSLAGHGAYLRFVSEGLTVAPLPGPAR